MFRGELAGKGEGGSKVGSAQRSSACFGGFMQCSPVSREGMSIEEERKHMGRQAW